MKRGVTILVIVVVLLLGAIVYVSNNMKSTPPSSTTAPTDDLSQPAPEVRVVEKSSADVISAFPANFPFEEGAVASQSYKFVPANSTDQQNTLSYPSNLSLVENAALFKKFLDDNGFEIGNKVEEASQYFYYATKDNNDLSILVQDNQGVVTVSVSYLVR